MPDITMCQDKECPMKNKCYRFTAVPSMRQSYFAESPREGNECKYKWSMTPENQRDEDLKKENLDEWVDECASCGRKVMVVRLSTIITVDSKRLVFCNLVCAKKVYKETR